MAWVICPAAGFPRLASWMREAGSTSCPWRTPAGRRVQHPHQTLPAPDRPRCRSSRG